MSRQANLKDQLTTKSGLAAQGTELVPQAQKPKTLAGQIQDIIPQLARALPNNMSADRMARIALTIIRTNPKLGLCKPESFLGALMSCSALGLEPNLAGQAYLVPYGTEVQMILGYKGLLDLVRRSGEVIGTPIARLVYANDIFDLEYGTTEDTFVHRPWYMRKDQDIEESGPILGGYLICRYKAGGADVWYLPIQKIEQRRSRSPARDSGPWQTDYEAMCLKTIVRAFQPWLPMSIEDRSKVAQVDEKVSKIDTDSLEMDYIDIMTDATKKDVPAPEENKAETVENGAS